MANDEDKQKRIKERFENVTDSKVIARSSLGKRGGNARERAIKYAAKGLQLVPVDRKTGQLSDISGPTTDPAMIYDWFYKGGIDVGIATGQEAGIVALRSKGKQGKLTLRALSTKTPIYKTLTATSSTESHLLFQAPGIKIPSKDQVALDLDFLGEGGYFVPPNSFWDDSTEIAPLPDYLQALVTGKASFGLTELAAAGEFSALNHATVYEAAQVYSNLGWKLIPLDENGDPLPGVERTYPPELWQERPDLGLGVETGSQSGIVGLWVTDNTLLQMLGNRFGELPLPQILGEVIVVCFRAPLEKFDYRDLFNGVSYVGERYVLNLPPSTINGRKHLWHVGMDFSPHLPELPQWLYASLTTPKMEAAPDSQSQNENSSPIPEQKESDARIQMGIAAQEYANRDWLVFPLLPNGKEPRVKTGFNAATRDRTQISKWWKKWPNANIGIRTGTESGIVVLDVDVKNDQPGKHSLAALEEQHGRIETLQAHTPSGGLHLYFLAPHQELQSRAAFLPGLDFRAQGGYIVAAPSRIGGQAYQWENPTVKIAAIPDWLITLLRTKQSASKGASPKLQERLSYGDALRGVMEGSRNDTIFRLACKLHQEGWEYSEALVIVKTAAGNCQPPLPEDEALRCLDSAWRYIPPAALTEIGNAERFVARYGEMVRYVPEQNRWLVWSEHHWKPNIRAVFRMAKETIRSLLDEANAEADPKRKRLLRIHGRKSESEQALNSMLALAGQELAVRAEDLDRSGLVAFANGVYDPKSKSIRPGRREDLLTKHVPFPYDPSDPDCLRLLEGGAALPTHGMAGNLATQRWQEEFEKWLAERCEVGKGLKAKASDLLEDFSTWLGEEVTLQRFGRLLRAKKFEREKSNVYWYHGLKLRNRTSAAAR